jgi:hypothetical protein
MWTTSGTLFTKWAVAQASASIITHEGAPSKLCLGGGVTRLDASVLSERYLPVLSVALSN